MLYNMLTWAGCAVRGKDPKLEHYSKKGIRVVCIWYTYVHLSLDKKDLTIQSNGDVKILEAVQTLLKNWNTNLHSPQLTSTFGFVSTFYLPLWNTLRLYGFTFMYTNIQSVYVKLDDHWFCACRKRLYSKQGFLFLHILLEFFSLPALFICCLMSPLRWHCKEKPQNLCLFMLVGPTN